MLKDNANKLKQKEVYLHIGFEKTGSTSIQKYFAENSDFLENHGVQYLSTRSNSLVYENTHWPIAATFSKNNKFVPPSKHITPFEIKTLVAELVENTNCPKIVFSAEPLSSMLLDESAISSLKKSFENYVVKIVAYIRRQDDFFLSHVSNWVKGGKIFSLSKRVTMEGTNIHYKKPERYNYDYILSMWESVFGLDNLIVRPFEQTALVDNDVIWDFLNILGVNSLDMPPTIRFNERLAIDTLLFLNFLNAGAAPALMEGYRVKVLNSLSEYPSRRIGQQLISNAFRNEIIEFYEETNQKVARKYLKNDGVLFESALPDVSQVWDSISPLEPKEILDLVVYLHETVPDVSDRIVRALCRPIDGKGISYLIAQQQLLPAYAEVVIGKKFNES